MNNADAIAAIDAVHQQARRERSVDELMITDNGWEVMPKPDIPVKKSG